MKITFKEILEELKTIGSGKTIDALIPPISFFIFNSLFGLNTAVIISISVALIIGIARFYKKQSWQYAFGGLIVVLIASGMAFLTKSPISYFIPDIIGSAILLIISLVSIIIGKPLAAWASHITRGWPLKWFWRKDVKPAYNEVTWFWTIFIAARLVIQLILYNLKDLAKLTWSNALLGWPTTIIVLTASYIYGIWRLKKLNGPGVQEFTEDKKPPWEGQKKGF